MLLYYRKHHGLSAWLAMMAEAVWYWMRLQRRRWSRNPLRRDSVQADRFMIKIMKDAWRDTKGGRYSPQQPW
jgi:hypothetical protein